MTIELEPIVIDTDETDEERARREALEAVQSMQLRIDPPASSPFASGQSDVMPDPQPPAAMAARGAQLGSAYRTNPPTSAPRIVNDAQGREQQRVYPAGSLPPPNPGLAQSGAEADPRAAQLGFTPVPRPGPIGPREPGDGGPIGPGLDRLAFDDMAQDEVEEAIRRRSAQRAMGGDMSTPRPTWLNSPPSAVSVSPRAPAGGGPSLDARTAMRGPGEAIAARMGGPPPPSPYTPDSPELLRMIEQSQARRAAGPNVQPQRPAADPNPVARKPPGNRPPDYTGVDTLDAFRGILHAIGSGLRGLSGRDPLPAPGSLGREARERDAATAASKQEGLQQRDAAQMAERRMALQERGLDAEIANRAEGRELERERIDLSETMQGRRAEIAAGRAQTTMEIARAQLARIENAAAREAAETDPTSQPSRTAQAGLRIALQGYPPAARERLEAEYGSIDDLDVRTARQVMQGLPSMFRDITARRGGGGGGSQARAALATPPAGWTGTPEAWAALPLDERQRRTGQLGTRQPQQGALEERVQQYGQGRSRVGLTRGRAAISGVREAISAARGAHGDDIPGVGMTGLLPGQTVSAEGRRVRAALRRMLDTELRAATGANAPDSEVRTFRTILGVDDYSSDEDLLRGLDQAEQWLRDQEDELAATWGNDAAQTWGGRFREAQSGTQVQQSAPAPSGPAQTAAPAQGGTVTIRSPSGEERDVPRAVWERNREAQTRRGFSEVPSGRR